jgi:acyl dehydratase
VPPATPDPTDPTDPTDPRRHHRRLRHFSTRVTIAVSPNQENPVTITVHVDDLPALAGKDLGASAWIDVTQQRIDTFADATDDHQWIHVDVARAAQGPFGGPIAHGYLTLALFIPAFTELLDVDGVTTKVNYGLDRVRFPAPVPAGARIRLTATVAEVAEVAGDGVQVTVDGAIEIEGATKPACVLRSISRFYR